MTKAQAATVANDLIVAGYVASVSASGATYRVQASDPSGQAVAASAISTFATSHSVTGQVYTAEFV